VFGGATRVVVAKHKKILTFERGRGEQWPDELWTAVLGPSGNLRAPALRLGKNWLVGFDEDAYAAALGL